MSICEKNQARKIIAKSIVDAIAEKFNKAPGTDSICASCSNSFQCEEMCESYKTQFTEEISNILSQK